MYRAGFEGVTQGTEFISRLSLGVHHLSFSIASLKLRGYQRLDESILFFFFWKVTELQVYSFCEKQ